MSQITIDQKKHIITNSSNDRPKIKLRDYIPPEYDITGIHIDFPENLKNIQIEMGGCCQNIIFYSDMTEYMKTFPFYLTLCKYIEIYIVFVYDEKFVDSQIKYEMVDEYIEKEKHGEEVTIYDGYDYHTGNIVTIQKILTGNKVPIVVQGLEINTPIVKIDIAINEITPLKNQIRTADDSSSKLPVTDFHDAPRRGADINLHRYKSTCYEQKVRQRIYFLHDNSEEYYNNLTKKFNLVKVNDKYGYIDNKIRYIQNFANHIYMF
jgi:hypothetical protein